MKALLTSLLSTILLLAGPSFGKSVFVELSSARTMGEDYNEGWKAGWAAGWKQVQGDYSFPPFAPFPPFPPFGTDNFMVVINSDFSLGCRKPSKSNSLPFSP